LDIWKNFIAKQVDDPNFVESKLHEAFDKFRIRDNREFFRMLPEHAKAALEIASGKDVTPKDEILSKVEFEKAKNKLLKWKNY